MASRFLRFFILAVLLVVIPSFVYLSQQQNGFVRDPKSGEWFSEDSYAHGKKPAQIQQGHGVYSNVMKGFSNLWNMGHATTPGAAVHTSTQFAAPTAAPAASVASVALDEPEVQGAYAHKMANATAKYVTMLTLGPRSAALRGTFCTP